MSLAAGVVVAAASVLPGLAPFADAPPAAAAVAPAVTTGAGPLTGLATSPASRPSGAAGAARGPATLKTLLGTAVPADWQPQRPRSGAPSPSAAPASAAADGRRARPTPVRDAAAAARSTDRPTLRRPVRDDGDPGPLRSVLPPPAERPSPPAHPVRALLADPAPLLTDPFPAVSPPPFPAALPTGLVPFGPALTGPVPAGSGEPPADQPPTGADPAVPSSGPVTSTPVRDAVVAPEPVVATFAGHEPALVRRGDG
jgi:hypothetical protein